MLENYLPVLIFIAVGLAVGVGAMFVGGYVLAPYRPDSAKNSPFEHRTLEGQVLQTVVAGRTVYPYD